MNKLLRKAILSILALTLGLQGAVSAQTTSSACESRTGIAFVYFNGVLTMPLEAMAARDNFALIYKEKTDANQSLYYDLYYNPTNGIEDFIETLDQRFKEEPTLSGRYELYLEVLRSGGTFWKILTGLLADKQSFLTNLLDYVQGFTADRLAEMVKSVNTNIVYLEHQARTDNHIIEGRSLLLVAHSQGNLFANKTYNYARSKTLATAVQEVHIAPATAVLNGTHILADKDRVIQLLGLVGAVPHFTDLIPDYLSRPSDSRGSKDILGHGLMEIYMNQRLEIWSSVNDAIKAAIGTLKAPPATATIGSFTVTLTWDGLGDVDLHTMEPNGNTVAFFTPVGSSGRLDVDNTWSNGPEHYFATCNKDNLQSGDYKISIANYFNADGRNATVQVASNENGVLGTKTVTLGQRTGTTPAYEMFIVSVVKDALNNKANITIKPTPG